MTAAMTSPSAGEGAEVERARLRARRDARRLAASVLGTEVVVFWLGIIAAVTLSGVSRPVAIAVGAALALGCVLAAMLLRTRAGYVLGSVIQLLAIACGVVVPVMFILGVIFAGLWVAAWRLGVQAIRSADQAGRSSGTS